MKKYDMIRLIATVIAF